MSKGADNRPEDLEQVMDAILESTRNREWVRVQDLLDVFELRLFGPLLILPALVLLTPVGAMPGAPAIVAAILTLIAGQRLLGLRHPWTPDWISEKSLAREKLESGFDRVRPWARRVDSVLRPRLEALVGGAASYAVAVLVIVLAAAMLPLGFIPFAVMAPAGAILMLGLALIARDGLLALIGYVLSFGSIGLAAYALL